MDNELKNTFDWSNAEHVKKLIVGIFLSRINIHVETARAYAVVATDVLAKRKPQRDVAAQLKVSPGRVKQIARELRKAAEKSSPDAPLSQHPLRTKSVPASITPDLANTSVTYWRRVLKSRPNSQARKRPWLIRAELCVLSTEYGSQ